MTVGVSARSAQGRLARVLARLLVLAVLVLAAVPVNPTAAAAGQIIVGLEPGVSIDTVLSVAGALSQPRSLGAADTFLITVADPAAASTALLQQSLVRYADPNLSFALPEGIVMPSSGNDLLDHWGLDQVRATQVPGAGTGAGVTVAVLDTGVSPTHPDLAGRVLPGYDFVSNHDGAVDDAGHGTFVAGIIAAAQSPAGDAGVAPRAVILPVKILDQNGAGSTANFIAGINYAVAQGAKVINISAGGIMNSQALLDALANAEAHGAVVVAAAGNDGVEETTYPASDPTVLAVTATDRADTVPSFATYGPFVDLAAPGVDIASDWWSASGGNGRMVASGTSAAAPFVAGAAALLESQHPGLSAATVRELLTESAVDIDSPGIDAHSGYGRLDVALASRLAAATPLQATVTASTINGSSHLSLSAGGFLPAEPVTALVTDDTGSHLVRGNHADMFGNLALDLGPLAGYPGDAPSVSVIGEISGVAASGALATPRTPSLAAFAPIAPFTSTANRLYFPETGHSLSYGFKTYWEQHGGLAVFGFPISEEFTEHNPDTGQDYTVQYFERNRFEYHPEYAGTPYEVSLGRLGVQIASQTYPEAPVPVTSDPAVLYFPETGHTLSGVFRAYWEQHGGLGLFGYPTSEPFEQNGHLVQYFERNRFEYHPEYAGTPYEVLLARFGVDLAYKNGYMR